MKGIVERLRTETWSGFQTLAEDAANELENAQKRAEYWKAGLAEANSEIDRLRAAIQQTLDENGHLADGDVCTLIVLKRAIEMV